MITDNQGRQWSNKALLEKCAMLEQINTNLGVMLEEAKKKAAEQVKELNSQIEQLQNEATVRQGVIATLEETVQIQQLTIDELNEKVAAAV